MIITSTGNSLKSKLDLRFGRAGWFCVFNTENQDTAFFENENKDINGGAGTKTVEKIAELGAEKVISGDFGPKAKALLEKLKIQMIIFDDHNKTVGDIVKKLIYIQEQQ